MAYHKAFWACVFLSFLRSLVLTVALDVRNMTIDEYVNYINPPAVHKYEDEFGDSILCAKHSDQISFHPEGHSKKGTGISYKGLKNISEKRCPEGTISVREIKCEHVERAGSVARFLADASDDDGVQEYAYINFLPGVATKAEAMIGSWSPYVTQPDGIYSRSQMWVASADLSSILVSGWQVYPRLYGDERPRIFTYWTADNFQSSGCYDLHCAGFVSSSSEIHPGMPIEKVSINGGTHYALSFQMSLEYESNTYVWALDIGNKRIGYWNTSFVPSLIKFANEVAFGGEVKFHSNGEGTPHTNTDMGSGHFPGSNNKEVAHIRQMQISDSSGKKINPTSNLMVNHKECYEAQYNIYEEPYGHTIHFGGPGGDVPQCRNIGI